MSERNPPLYCTITLIAVQGHQTKQRQNVGEKPTITLYNYIDRHAGTPNKTKTKDTISLNYSSICYIASRTVVAGVHLNFMWSGVGKPNHNDEPCIKPVMFVFLQADSPRTVRLLATASGDVNRSVLVAHGWPVNYMGGC